MAGQPNKDYNDILKKAKGIGIDLEVVVAEILRRAAIDTTKSQEKLFDTLAQKFEEIKGRIPDTETVVSIITDRLAGQIFPIDEITEKVLKKLPPSGDIDIKKLKEEITQEVQDLIPKIKGELGASIEGSVDQVFNKYRAAMLADVNAKLESHIAQLNSSGGGSEEEGGGGEGGGGKMSLEGLVAAVKDLVPLFKESPDPFAALSSSLETVKSIRELVGKVDGTGSVIDPNLQFTTNSKILMEGIRIGSRAKQGADVKKSSDLPGRSSSQRTESSSGSVDPIVSGLNQR